MHKTIWNIEQRLQPNRQLIRCNWGVTFIDNETQGKHFELWDHDQNMIVDSRSYRDNINSMIMWWQHKLAFNPHNPPLHVLSTSAIVYAKDGEILCLDFLAGYEKYCEVFGFPAYQLKSPDGPDLLQLMNDILGA
jgi:hypothetical protein